MRDVVVLLLLLVLAVGCAERRRRPDQIPEVQASSHLQMVAEWGTIREFRDREHRVTCWVFADYNLGGISCLRDDREP